METVEFILCCFYLSKRLTWSHVPGKEKFLEFFIKIYEEKIVYFY